ncbi:hypothetical protein Bbelb_276350 [Branchiostoma belcheri]|nr:hypothetical protein Bbelb_276350 [Branchiostoma belcheri]
MGTVKYTRSQKRHAQNEGKKSAVTDHIARNNCVIDWEGAKVIDREDNKRTRWIKEAVWIRKSAPVMNRDEEGRRDAVLQSEALKKVSDRHRNVSEKCGLTQTNGGQFISLVAGRASGSGKESRNSPHISRISAECRRGRGPARDGKAPPRTGILYKPVRACFPPLSTYAGGDGNVRDREQEILRKRTGGGGDECRRKDDGRFKVSNTHPPALFVSVQRPLDDPSGDTPDFSVPNPLPSNSSGVSPEARIRDTLRRFEETLSPGCWRAQKRKKEKRLQSHRRGPRRPRPAPLHSRPGCTPRLARRSGLTAITTDTITTPSRRQTGGSFSLLCRPRGGGEEFHGRKATFYRRLSTHGAVHGHFLPCTGMYRDRVRAYNAQYTACTQKVVHFRECTGHVRDWTRFVCRLETPGFYRKPKISGKVCDNFSHGNEGFCAVSPFPVVETLKEKSHLFQLER